MSSILVQKLSKSARETIQVNCPTGLIYQKSVAGFIFIAYSKVKLLKKEIPLLPVISWVWSEPQTPNLYQYESLEMKKLSHLMSYICMVSILQGNYGNC